MAQLSVLSQGSWRRRSAWMLIAFSIVLFAIALVLYVANSLAAPASNAFEKLTDVPLPGGLPNFDQQALDPQTRLLFLAHAGGSEVVVFDTTTQRVVAQIKGIKRNHGLVVVPQVSRIYVSETFDNQVYVIDEKTYHILGRIAVGQKPDTIPASKPQSGLSCYGSSRRALCFAHLPVSLRRNMSELTAVRSPLQAARNFTNNVCGELLWYSVGLDSWGQV